MAYTDLESLKAHMGETAYAQWVQEHPQAQITLALCEERLRAAVFPVQIDDATAEPFARAVYAQLVHEAECEAPEGVQAFRVGEFSATLSERRPALCTAARAVLKNAGLLYRGVPC